MNTAGPGISTNTSAISNGSGAAAVVAAGLGCFVLAALAIAGDKSASIKSALVFYKPTGPLSGVTTAAIVIWLFAWVILDWRWRNKTASVARSNAVAFILLGLSLLLTFPPIADLF